MGRQEAQPTALIPVWTLRMEHNPAITTSLFQNLNYSGLQPGQESQHVETCSLEEAVAHTEPTDTILLPDCYSWDHTMAAVWLSDSVWLHLTMRDYDKLVLRYQCWMRSVCIQCSKSVHNQWWSHCRSHPSASSLSISLIGWLFSSSKIRPDASLLPQCLSSSAITMCVQLLQGM